MTEEIRSLMKIRDKWRKLARKTNDPLHWSGYKTRKREVKRELRLAEREFVADQIKNNPNNAEITPIPKMAEITPIPKEGDHEQANNNRPISLLPMLSKVCEKVVLNQVVSYLDINKRLSTEQSGNKKYHSTETSLIETTDTFLHAIDKKEVTAVVLLDMSKAFDSLDHKILGCRNVTWRLKLVLKLLVE